MAKIEQFKEHFNWARSLFPERDSVPSSLLAAIMVLQKGSKNLDVFGGTTPYKKKVVQFELLRRGEIFEEFLDNHPEMGEAIAELRNKISPENMSLIKQYLEV